jgi:hypothetical protein
MRPIHLVLVTFALAIPATGVAQSADTVPDGKDANAAGTISPAPKKKGGLFGKAKGLAKNKVVKQVMKTAACTMVPGGQLIASAIDGGAEGAAGGAAAGLATGQTGCMPGAGLLPNPASAAGEAAAKAAGAKGMGAGLPGVGFPGMPTVPAQGYSPDQIKQMQEHYKKMGIDAAQLQEMMAAMPGATGAPAAAAPVAEESPPPSYVLVKEKRRMVLRGLAWVSGSAAVQPGREAIFGRAIFELAAEIRSGSKNYKIEVKVEDQGSKEQSRSLARKRADVIVGALAGHRLPQGRVIPAGGSADKDPRVIVSETTQSR